MSHWTKDERSADPILARLDALRGAQSTLPSLTELEATLYREGEATVLAFPAGTCLVLPAAAPRPWAITEGFAFDPPVSFGEAMAISDGMELSHVSVESWPADSGEVIRAYTRFFTGSGREAFESWRDDWIGPILEDPEDYGYDATALALNDPADFMAVYDDSNGTFGGFHRQTEGPSGEPAFVLWMHDEPMGFFARSLQHAATLTYGDYLVASLLAHATDGDSYELLFPG